MLVIRQFDVHFAFLSSSTVCYNNGYKLGLVLTCCVLYQIRFLTPLPILVTALPRSYLTVKSSTSWTNSLILLLIL